MLTILFWNLAKGNLATEVSALVFEHHVDILLLAESAVPPGHLLQLLNPPAATRYNFVPSRDSKIRPSKIQIFFGFGPQFISSRTDTGRATIREVRLPGRTRFLLCGVHFQSRPVWGEKDQALESTELNRTIREEERKAGHSRTIVVGDFNMNPFDLGVTSASGFNAVMTRQIALQRKRTLADRDHPFFFNSMWGLFGDGSSRPGGTFFLPSPQYASIYWHMLDQVLIRPDLIPEFEPSSLRILSEYSGGRLTAANGRPSVSDHLPILFKMNV